MNEKSTILTYSRRRRTAAAEDEDSISADDDDKNSAEDDDKTSAGARGYVAEAKNRDNRRSAGYLSSPLHAYILTYSRTRIQPHLIYCFLCFAMAISRMRILNSKKKKKYCFLYSMIFWLKSPHTFSQSRRFQAQPKPRHYQLHVCLSSRSMLYQFGHCMP